TRLKSHFNEKEHIRELEVDGEAYFEVAHQYIAQGSQKRSVPFLVKTPNYTIKVLGTSFNVSAYKGDASKTTLVEGSIEINIPTTNLKQLLKPNQQALFLNNTIAITEVESSNYTSWKDGTFNFSDENLEGILRQVARWYDVEIRFQNDTLK